MQIESDVKTTESEPDMVRLVTAEYFKCSTHGKYVCIVPLNLLFFVVWGFHLYDLNEKNISISFTFRKYF